MHGVVIGLRSVMQENLEGNFLRLAPCLYDSSCQYQCVVKQDMFARLTFLVLVWMGVCGALQGPWITDSCMVVPATRIRVGSTAGIHLSVSTQ
jgi:hypothetical protein